MPKRKNFNQDRYEWKAPLEMWEALKEEGLFLKDKIEIVYAFYAKGHNGNAPSIDDVATILELAKTTIADKIKILVKEERLVQIDGRYSLKNSKYTHPATREHLS